MCFGCFSGGGIWGRDVNEATTHEAEATTREAEAEASTHDNAKHLIIYLVELHTPQLSPALLRNKNRSVSFTVAC